MNQQSIENIRLADFARIETLPSGLYAVSLWLNGQCAFLYTDNMVSIFQTHFDAFNAVFKVRNDIPFNQFPRHAALNS